MPRYQGKALVGALKSGRSAAIRVVPRSEIVPEASSFCFFGDLIIHRMQRRSLERRAECNPMQ